MIEMLRFPHLTLAQWAVVLVVLGLLAAAAAWLRTRRDARRRQYKLDQAMDFINERNDAMRMRVPWGNDEVVR